MAERLELAAQIAVRLAEGAFDIPQEAAITGLVVLRGEVQAAPA